MSELQKAIQSYVKENPKVFMPTPMNTLLSTRASNTPDNTVELDLLFAAGLQEEYEEITEGIVHEDDFLTGDFETIKKFFTNEYARLETYSNEYRPTKAQYMFALKMVESAYLILINQDKVIFDLGERIAGLTKQLTSVRGNFNKAIALSKVWFQIGRVVVLKTSATSYTPEDCSIDTQMGLYVSLK